MKKITDNIKNPTTQEYFGAVVSKRQPSVELSPDEYADGIEDVIAGLDAVISDARNEVVRRRLGATADAISFSYIARKYFGKSRAWLMQKVNGNTVNGKQASFTDEERERFRAALQDISQQLSHVALSL